MAYAKRYSGGFKDRPDLTTPVDSAFLNAVEENLLYRDFGPGAPPEWRPFAATSPFNKLIPAAPTLHANSANIVAKVVSAGWNSSKPADIPLGVASEGVAPFNNDFDHPVYFPKSTDPLYTIGPTGDAYSGWSGQYGTQIRIPDGARGANGSDAHLTVIDLLSGYVHDFYHFQFLDALRQVPAGGGSIIAKAGMRELLTGDGVCDSPYGGMSVPADAAGFSLACGMIRPEELLNGRINHALSMVVKSTDGTFAAPAVGTAGSSDPVNAPPCGVRFRLNMTLAQINALTAPWYRKVIWRAMAEYGMYVRDTGSSSWTVQVTGSYPYILAGQADPWRTFAEREGIYYSSGSDYHLLELHPAGAVLGTNVPDWGTKLQVLNPLDPANY